MKHEFSRIAKQNICFEKKIFMTLHYFLSLNYSILQYSALDMVLNNIPHCLMHF